METSILYFTLLTNDFASVTCMMSLAGHRSWERDSLVARSKTVPKHPEANDKNPLRGNLPRSVQQDRSMAKKILFSWERSIALSILGRPELLSACLFKGRFILCVGMSTKMYGHMMSLWHAHWFWTEPSASNKSTSKRSHSMRTHLVSLHRRHSMDLHVSNQPKWRRIFSGFPPTPLQKNRKLLDTAGTLPALICTPMKIIENLWNLATKELPPLTKQHFSRKCCTSSVHVFYQYSLQVSCPCIFQQWEDFRNQLGFSPFRISCWNQNVLPWSR